MYDGVRDGLLESTLVQSVSQPPEDILLRSFCRSRRPTFEPYHEREVERHDVAEMHIENNLFGQCEGRTGTSIYASDKGHVSWNLHSAHSWFQDI